MWRVESGAAKSLWSGILIMLLGFVIMAVGMWIYMRACQCCGPRDSLLVGIGKTDR